MIVGVNVFQRLGSLDDSAVVQLAVLWFVALGFLQLDAGPSPPVVMVGEVLAVLLVLTTPFAVVIHIAER
jgi:hypothetical protein